MNKKLYRSRRARVFGGVAGGLGDYFNLDPILVRIIFVIITFATGVGILLYIILWIVIPEEPFELAYKINLENTQTTTGESTETNSKSFEQFQVEPQKSKGSIIAGVILIGIGLVFFADRFIPSFRFGDIFPIVLVLIGIALIWNSVKK
ncbi:MAG: PspC domain-containing protein [Bacteroidota bacterium]